MAVSKQSCRNAASTFMSKTTAHGLPSIKRGRIVKRIIWSVTFLGCIVGFLYHLYCISSWYGSYAVDTRTQFHHERKLDFPSVTVCNMNPMKMSMMQQSPRLSSLFQKWGVKVHAPRVRRSGVEDKLCASKSNDGSKCYWLAAPLALFYSTGEMMCEMDGGQIVTAQVEEEYDNIAKVFNSTVPTADPTIFLNLHYMLADKNFLWDKKVPLSWTGWFDGFPTFQTLQTCVTSKVKNGYFWKNVNCAITSAYCVCEKASGSEDDGPGTTEQTVSTVKTTENDVTTEQAQTTVLLETDEVPEQTTSATSSNVPILTDKQSQEEQTSANPLVTEPFYSAFTTNTDPVKPQTTPTYEPPLPIPGPGSAFPDRPPLRESFMLENEVLEFLADAPLDLKKALGYTFDEFVLDCRFDGKDCMNDGFGTFFDSRHGNCYVFNSKWANTTEKSFRTYMAGRNHGLELVINIEQEEYIPNLIDGAGAVVVVHPSQRMPFPEDEGVLAMPGQVTSVGITQIKVERLDGSYGNCTKILRDKTRNVFEEEHNVHYSINACYKTCYQYHVIRQCGCADPQYPIKGHAFSQLADNIMACNSQNVTQEDCVYNITLEYNKNNLACNCTNTCIDTFYKHSVSTSEWPSEVFAEDVLEKYAAKLNKTTTHRKMPLRSNLLKVEVYFNQLNYKYIKEKPKYTLFQYMSDVGAILGLWLGMSIISIFEVAQLLMDICCPSQGTNQNNENRRKSMFDSLEELGERKSSYDWSKNLINGMLKSRTHQTTQQNKPTAKKETGHRLVQTNRDFLTPVETPDF